MSRADKERLILDNRETGTTCKTGKVTVGSQLEVIERFLLFDVPSGIFVTRANLESETQLTDAHQ